MNGGGSCTGAHALPPQEAAAAASKLVMSGTTTRKKRPPTTDETRQEAKKQRHHHHHHLQVVVLGRRKYEDDESDVEVGCRENDKMFKCNYWEDPAYAKRLQRDGLQRARIAALENQTERLFMHLEFDEPAPDAPQPPPEPLAGASDPPIIVSRPEVPNCPDRYRRFDHDYW